MINLEVIPRQRLFGGPFVLVSFLFHALFFVGILPSINFEMKKPNVPVMVRVLTDMPKPKKAETPLKNKAALSNADRRAKAPKEVKRDLEPKVPKKRIEKKVVEPIRRQVRPEEKIAQKPIKQKLEPPKPKKTVVAKVVEQPKFLPRPQPTPPIPPQGVPELRKLPLLSGADLERYAVVDQDAQESEVVSLDTRDFRYISYFAHIKRKIELSWAYPEEAARAGIFGELMVQFTLLRDGSLEGVRLVRSSGSRILDEEAVRAIEFANPYNPFPRRITKNKLQINAVFSYLPSLSALR
jgi:protein TonB